MNIFLSWNSNINLSSYCQNFKLIEYIRYNHMFNMVKNLNDGFPNKPTSPQVNGIQGKMSTNNMIKFKRLKYTCF